MSEAGKTIAFFDFDGTMTTADTMFVFFKFARGSALFYLVFVLLSPVFVLYKLKLLSGHFAKEAALFMLFKGISQEKLQNFGVDFCEKKLETLLRKKALERWQWHKSQGHEVWIVSASCEEWLRPWADKNGMPLICSSLEYKNGRFTGRLRGKNCNGPEKARRIGETVDLSKYQNIYAYGDTSGDKQMLALATYPEFKPFR